MFYTSNKLNICVVKEFLNYFYLCMNPKHWQQEKHATYGQTTLQAGFRILCFAYIWIRV